MLLDRSYIFEGLQKKKKSVDVPVYTAMFVK